MNLVLIALWWFLVLLQLFVELDELVTHQNEDNVEIWEWKEKSRWIKFEEDVLGEADRWGLPHVSFLSFRSLIDLYKILENGTKAVIAR